MRPHLLRFSGIGSFPGDVEINFDDLGAMGLYLIVGRTGAGKTTIFDAMTYALYGKVAADRENAIASGYTDAKAPVIEFTFSHGPHRYVAHREPGHNGRSAAPNKQWLSIQTPDGNETRRLTKTREVNAEVEAILGLDEEKFMQVILLPQGKFQQFLLAKSSEKKGMLQAIFGTLTYNRIVRRLEDQSKVLDEEVRQDSIDLTSQHTIVTNEMSDLLSSGIFDDLPDPFDNLDELVEIVTAQSTLLDGEDKQARSAHADAKSNLARGKQEAVRFDTGVRLAELQQAHSAAARDTDKASKQVSDHDRAVPVADAVATHDSACVEVDRLRSTSDDARSAIARDAKRFRIAETQTRNFVSAVPTASPTSLAGELTKLRSSVDTALENFDDLDEVARDLKDETAAQKDLEKDLANLVEALSTAETNRKKASDNLTAARLATRGLRAAEKAADNLSKLLDAADVAGAEAELASAMSALASAQTAFDKAETALRDAHQRRTHELAGELATMLTSGQQCPVCGSTDHPKKAKKPTTPVNLEAVEARRDKANDKRREAERAHKDAQKSLEAAQTARKTLPPAAKQREIMKTYDDLLALSEEEADLAIELEEASDAVGSIGEEIAGAKSSIAATKSMIKELTKRHKGLQSAVDALGTRKDVEAARDVITTIEAQLRTLDGATGNLSRAEGRAKEAASHLARTLTASGFATAKAALAKVLDDDVVEQLRAGVDAAREREIQIGKLQAAVGSEPLPKNRPNIEALSELVQATEEAATDAASKAGTVEASKKRIVGARAEIRRLGPVIEEKRSRAATASSMASVFARGGGELLDLETWVQRTLFEEVCLVANGQMRTLSNNRYTLTLEQEEGGVRRRRGGGLDIYVLDAQTGLTRPVHTMSGGEQFMASLALALALAEVVQRHAGGIELPCLFIDEGFGGLDLESLDLAIDVLLQLQASGRTVGIITHVEAMQQQLPIGIRVHKTDHGSTLEVLAD